MECGLETRDAWSNPRPTALLAGVFIFYLHSSAPGTRLDTVNLHPVIDRIEHAARKATCEAETTSETACCLAGWDDA